MPKRWIQSALLKGRPGALRARLREVRAIPKDAKRIPVKVLDKAARGIWGPVTARRARLAKTLRKFRG